MWKGAMAHDFRQQRCFKLLKSQSLSYDLLNAPSERFVSCPLWEICFNKYGKSKAMKYKINNKEIRLKSKNHNRWWWRAFSSPSLPQELARLVLFLITITANTIPIISTDIFIIIEQFWTSASVCHLGHLLIKYTPSFMLCLVKAITIATTINMNSSSGVLQTTLGHRRLRLAVAAKGAASHHLFSISFLTPLKAT